MAIPPDENGTLRIVFDSGAHGEKLTGALMRQVFIASNGAGSSDSVALLQEVQRLQNRLWRYAHIRRSVSIDFIDWAGTDRATRAGYAQRISPAANSGKTPDTASKASALNSNGRNQRESRDSKPPNGHAARRYRRTRRKHGNCYVKRYWRNRKDPFADVWNEVQKQLEQAPDISAKKLFKALQQKYPWKYKDGQLRTFQRRIKEWRLKTVSSELEAQAVSDRNTEKGTNEQSKILT